ncbi:MAG: prolipoprotein diacylglyceryl transferase [Bryobacterales bacterium]
MAIAYALGESVGRLACISFGCCYGKPVEQTSGWVRRFASRYRFVFHGSTKKAAFASRLDGVAVVPVQAMTSVALAAVAWLSTLLFLQGRAAAAFALAATGTQLWRLYSETLRADYRGEGRISAYQWMAAGVAVCGLTFFALAGGQVGPRPDLAAGLTALAHPAAILALQFLFGLVFWRMGRSSQTGARIHFHVHLDRI